LKILAKMDPLYYGIDGLRYVFTGVSNFNPWLDLMVLVVLSVAVTLVGKHLFNKMEA
jgi:ABC-type polysaccharide/polyol phosphate export permease